MFADNRILCIENPKTFTKQKVLEVIKGLSDVEMHMQKQNQQHFSQQYQMLEWSQESNLIHIIFQKYL